MEFFFVISTGLIVGWLSGQFMSGKGFGVVGDIIAGAFGALIGGALLEKAGIFSDSGLLGSILASATGAIVLLYGVRMVKKA